MSAITRFRCIEVLLYTYYYCWGEEYRRFVKIEVPLYLLLKAKRKGCTKEYATMPKCIMGSFRLPLFDRSKSNNCYQWEVDHFNSRIFYMKEAEFRILSGVFQLAVTL